jgi:hypothetical protein
MPAIEILVDGLDHPECVCWDPGAELLWAGGEAGRLYRIDPGERRAEEIARAPGFVLGVAVDGRGRVVACCSDEGLLCVLDDGAVRVVRDGLGAPNYPAFAPDGTLYVSDTGSWGADDGRVWRLSPDGELEVFSTDRIVHLDSAGVVEIVAEDPQGTLLSAPTNIAFAGRELDRLVCANLGRWHLSLVESGLRGAPLHYPTHWAADA